MKKRRTWIVLIAIAALLLAGGGGYAAYTRYFVVAEEPPEPVLQTATVMQGDIVITADGSGELVPGTELELAFRASGVLADVLVEVSDQVQAGDVLARLETDDLERAMAEADVELQLAQLDLADVQAGPGEAELADAQAALRDAQVDLAQAQHAYQDALGSDSDAIVNSRKVEFDWWVGYYQAQKAEYETGHLSQADHDWAMAAMIAAEGRWQEAINQAKSEQVQAANRVTQAKNTVYQAQEDLQLLESEPLTDTLTQAILAVDQAVLAYKKAVANLEAVQLYAPFDGTVMDVTATVGEQVGANTSILTLADLKEPLVRFWVEETDMNSVVVGNRVNIIFEALPDDVFTGEIIRVDPLLVTVDNTPAVEAWASLDLGTQAVGDQAVGLLSGMTAEVEIIVAETRNAPLAPVAALRELAEDQYAVFVVGPAGELAMRPVKVGLMDPVNAEILDGLEVGDVVSIGETE